MVEPVQKPVILTDTQQQVMFPNLGLQCCGMHRKHMHLCAHESLKSVRRCPSFKRCQHDDAQLQRLSENLG